MASSWSLHVNVTAIFVLSEPDPSQTGSVELDSRGTGNGEMDLGITLIGTAGEGGTVSGAGISIDGFSIVELACVSSAFSGVVKLGPAEFDFEGPVEFDPLVKLVLWGEKAADEHRLLQPKHRQLWPQHRLLWSKIGRFRLYPQFHPYTNCTLTLISP